MTRALIAVGAALALLVGGLALAVFLTRDEDGIQVDNLLSEDFTREVASADANGTDLDLAEIAPFEWSRDAGAGRSSRFRIMDRAVRLPGLRSFDRNFVRLPERLRWLVERLVHDPDSGAAPKPELPAELRLRLEELFRDDGAELERVAGRRFGWL